MQRLRDTICLGCGNFIPKSRMSFAKYCSDKCRIEHSEGGSGLELASGTTGAIAELLISADLMRKGWNVFRALSPSCPCDLIIMRDNIIKRIEVRSGYRLPSTGNLGFPKKNSDLGKSDHFAIYVHRTGEICYLPEID